LRHLSLARGGHCPKLNAKDMKLPTELPVMTLPNLTLFPPALLETADLKSRLQRRIQFMIQEIRNHRRDSHE
jgi:hypothetical protein